VNLTLAELSGQTDEEIIGRPPSEFFPQSVAAAMESALRRVLETDRSAVDVDLSIDCRARAPSRGRATGPPPLAEGETRLWASSWFPSHDKDGKILGVALIAVDVTDRRRAEDVIRRKEERYRSLVDASSQCLGDRSLGRVIDDAPEWRAITGQTYGRLRRGLAARGPPRGQGPDRRCLAGVAWTIPVGPSRPATGFAPGPAHTATTKYGRAHLAW